MADWDGPVTVPLHIVKLRGSSPHPFCTFFFKFFSSGDNVNCTMKEKHGNEYFQYLDLVLRCALQMEDVSELYISIYSDTSQLTYY